MSDSNVIVYPRDYRIGEGDGVLSIIAKPLGSIAPSSPELELYSPVGQPIAAARSQPGVTAWRDVELEICDNLGAVAQDWKTFEAGADCTAFQAFDWLSKWQRHIGTRLGTMPAIVIGRDAAGDVLFILPLAIEKSGRLRRLTWLGIDLCDYNGPLLAARFAQHAACERFPALWGEIVKRLCADSRFRFDFIDLGKMPETLGAQKNPFLKLKVMANPSGAYVATLANNWDAFYAAKRSSATRKRERRQLKHLAEFGEVRFVEVWERHDIERTLKTLIEQKTRSFARMGVENLFARPGYRAFFLDAATDPGAGSIIHVSRLDVGSMIAAVNLGLHHRDCYYLTFSSYHDGEIARFGPGRAHLHELLRHAIERGFRWFDFTIGDEPYKSDWSDKKLTLYDHVAAVTTPGQLAVAVTVALRRTTRFIKQTPALWRTYCKARALAGSIKPRRAASNEGPP